MRPASPFWQPVMASPPVTQSAQPSLAFDSHQLEVRVAWMRKNDIVSARFADGVELTLRALPKAAGPWESCDDGSYRRRLDDGEATVAQSPNDGTWHFVIGDAISTKDYDSFEDALNAVDRRLKQLDYRDC